MKTKFNIEEHRYAFKGWMQEQIDDHKSGSIRVLDIVGIGLDHEFKIIPIKSYTHYFTKDGVYLPEFTHETREKGRKWRIDDTYDVFVRDERGEIVKGEDDVPLEMDAYEAFSQTAFKVLKPMLSKHIQIDNANREFDENTN
ncbi:hypothetical protein EDL99_09805 [Ornithobacterium rhinotracheale]|uniref:hypothetical protein n=1 Tax=Ornithobacterium rhinotracheale TaxID=28251 RepID=UPI00129CF2DA|nr:hypothetical protein [Ornithobacterium rhinotracheale]MRJ09150.1 hypothetical protein [Ornithobacterium rhinotracheale]UOH77265.1 hypothetical protein MT996_08585 [Ornithobacterium rhinotracheale]